MPDLRRLSVLAIGLVVLLRVAIGWQFFYEGVWKLDTLDTAQPWSAEGYLKNAQGPFRNAFRGMVDDPDDLNWLDYESVSARWDDWHDRFVAHYELNDDQQRRLRILLDNHPKFFGRLQLDELPEGVEIGGSLAKAIEYDPNRKVLVVDGRLHLTPDQRDTLLRLPRVYESPDDDAQKRQNELAAKFREAVDDAFKRSSPLSFREQLAVLLKGDPERITIVQDKYEGTVYHKRIGRIDEYKERLNRYEASLADAKTSFQHDHLADQQRKIRDLHAELVGPVKALEDELHWRARDLLDEEQLALGPVPQPRTGIDTINALTMWSLLILGGLLIVGLASRVAAFGGALLVLSFYLAMPPWPGVPQPPGPEHSLFVNKNLIEVIALFALAAMPTGQWFGLDSLLRRLFVRDKSRPKKRKAKSPSAGPARLAPSGGKPSEPVKEPGRPRPAQPVAQSEADDKTYQIKTSE